LKNNLQFHPDQEKYSPSLLSPIIHYNREESRKSKSRIPRSTQG
jgi:hypothetical protein